jgi:predicted homoserine dehydrogenase-like protein
VTVRATSPTGVVDTAVVAVLVVGVGVVVEVPHDVSNIATTINKLKPNQTIFFFIFSPFLLITNLSFY